MKLCLFDIDGTLLSSGGAGKAAMDLALASEFDIHVPIVHMSIAGRTDRSIARDQFQLHGVPNTQENWERLVAGYLRELPGSLERTAGAVLPGIGELLTQLKARADEFAIGLLTGNMQNGAHLKLQHYQLADFFSFGGFGDAHLTRELVAQEARQNGIEFLDRHVPSDAIVVIGDTPHDIRCARHIEAAAVAVTTGLFDRAELEKENPDLLLDDLTDPEPFWQLLESLGAR